uniref:Beta-catenin-interacting ICAT domain-containing protein n=1 Tax=Mantoniella antarctica TaxID=81844 RepID=A0A7S0SJE1_9CHLO|mmetsp:Transcript_27270/g.68278  ORF Transcript_27270/g.68278 Transcript_27270/m.68278 type:complete len:168 (+) Transcript_27270:417-920(+)|eukprot:CAMPEP_0181360826 /NCGR_PEP_ID=MMETSP1106-20121128/6905_1 /TAXON_ID=81844 /ORGANISM="Mantoniella antarctica, Strain SL-175" /LENGTH=167 /DNA_ID=CAMNT_0023474189 /DNA_START=370 /DNA_END=873 /DNA_ORIENTATION=+
MSQNAELRASAAEQVTRLLTQLADLEELRAELEEDEYEDSKADTLQQLEEFKASLARMAAGDVTLVDDLECIRLATQAAVSRAFQTPEILRMFALKQPMQLRERLTVLQRDRKLGKGIAAATYSVEVVEILTALKKLGGDLSGEERAFLQDNITSGLAAFEKVVDEA